MNSFRILLLLGLLLAATAPDAAYAQDDKKAVARIHYENGRRFFKDGNYDEALRELDKAYRLDPSPTLVFNIARVHEERGDLPSAIRYYKSYLAINPRAKNARKVRKTIRRLKSMTSMGRLVVTSNPPGASVWIDGRRVGQTPTKAMPTATGVRLVEIKLSGFSTFAENVLINKGQTSRLTASMRASANQVVITTNPPGAQATIYLPKAKNLGSCPCRLELSPGRYRLRVTQNGYLTSDVQIVKSKGQPLQVPITLAPANPNLTPGYGPSTGPTGYPDTDDGYTPEDAVLETDGESGVLTTWGWVCLGTGIASVVGGGAFTTLALVNKYNFDNGTYYRPTEAQNTLLRHDISQVDAFELERQAQLYMNISYGLYAAGGAAMATGLFLILTDEGPADEESAVGSRATMPMVSVSPTPGGAMAQYGFRF